jgi:hypothetical protein
MPDEEVPSGAGVCESPLRIGIALDIFAGIQKEI